MLQTAALCAFPACAAHGLGNSCWQSECNNVHAFVVRYQYLIRIDGDFCLTKLVAGLACFVDLGALLGT